MLLKGLIHGAAISALAILIAFFLPYVTQDINVLKLLTAVILATPFLYIGYKFRGKIEVSLFDYIFFHNQKLWLYPISAALITATTSTLLTIFSDNTNKLGAFLVATIYAMSVLGHAAKITTIIFIGSWLNRNS